MLTIRNVRVILVNPASENLVIVKVETSEPELFGLGCATYTQRYRAVAALLLEHLRPLLIGRDPHRIEALWRLMHLNGYWRHGPVVNNAISGVDMALWDIKAKLAQMPLYELLGGKCREAATVYQHAAGTDEHQLLDSVHALLDTGVTHCRVQIAHQPHATPDQLRPQTAGYGGLAYTGVKPAGALDGAYYDPRRYTRQMLRTLAYLRTELDDAVELIHDVHERLDPADTVAFARDLESFRLFFLEDPLPPEQLDWLANIRSLCATPLALGELFVHPNEWQPLIQQRRLDFIRMHVSAIGGITPARKAAVLAEAHDVRTAWHGPKDVSPVGHAANLHLNLASPNFGIQEFPPFTQAEREIFNGLPELRDGYLYPNDRPGLGIDLNENVATRFPASPRVVQWTQSRRPDGSLARP